MSHIPNQLIAGWAADTLFSETSLMRLEPNPLPNMGMSTQEE